MREVIGHQQAQMLLTRAVASGQVSHAYLFAGPDAIGKTTLALAFAQLLECEQPDLPGGEPCGVCASCRKVQHGNHPDVTLVEPEEGKRLLGVDAVREAVVRLANLAPSTGRWRVFILPNVDRMTANTVNALLKTLEEPPPGVVLLLTSAEPENLLPTLLSRCQLVTLQPLP
ncbi:MAG: DNA polymerase III subunit delta', partial [Ktedonobacterales bacterium]